MSELSRWLLPSGLSDLLPPQAAQLRRVIGALLDGFAANGYAQVEPPLIEAEASLLAGRGEDLARASFRLMDPLSNELLAFRTDITPQLVRLAQSRLADSPRPLRLAYAGPVLRTRGEGVKKQRQRWQAGLELIGAAAPAADAEVIRAAAEGLQALGLPELSIDLNLPHLATEMVAASGLSETDRTALHQAIAQRDRSAIQRLPDFAGKPALLALMDSTGNADMALAALKQMAAGPATQHAASVAAMLSGVDGLAVTIDALEDRGFTYHHHLSFSLFAPGCADEIGSGGRYLLEDGAEATGLTLYLERILPLLASAPEMPLVWLPCGTDDATRRRLQSEGYRTLRGLVPEESPEGRGCTHIWDGKRLEPLS